MPPALEPHPPLVEQRCLFARGGALPADAHPKIRQLVDYWHALPSELGMLPGRQQFDPLQVHALLPHLWLLDVSTSVIAGTPLQFKVRLIGGGLVAAGTPMRK